MTIYVLFCHYQKKKKKTKELMHTICSNIAFSPLHKRPRLYRLQVRVVTKSTINRVSIMAVSLLLLFLVLLHGQCFILRAECYSRPNMCYFVEETFELCNAELDDLSNGAIKKNCRYYALEMAALNS